MRFENVFIESWGYHLPDKVLTSSWIEGQLEALYGRLKLSPGRLEFMTGVRERRVWESGKLPSDLSTAAAQNNLKDSKLKIEDIDLLIHSAVCRDYLEPATASRVHALLNLPKSCRFFDLSNACLGFLNAMGLAANLIEAKQIKSCLVVSGENGGPLLEQTLEVLKNNDISRKELKKYVANLSIGSCAVSVLLSHRDLCDSGPQLIGSVGSSDTSGHQLCRGGGDPHTLMMETDSEGLLNKGLQLGLEAWTKAHKIFPSEPDKIITHQVGSRHKDLIYQKLALAPEKDFSTFATLGNTGSAAVPITFMKAMEEKFILPGDNVALLGIGSGLSAEVLGVQC